MEAPLAELHDHPLHRRAPVDEPEAEDPDEVGAVDDLAGLQFDAVALQVHLLVEDLTAISAAVLMPYLSTEPKDPLPMPSTLS